MKRFRVRHGLESVDYQAGLFDYACDAAEEYCYSQGGVFDGDTLIVDEIDEEGHLVNQASFEFRMVRDEVVVWRARATF